MKYTSLVMSGLLMGFVFLMRAPHTEAAEIDKLIAAAKQEGTINFYAQVQLGPKGAEALAEAFNKKHRLNTKLNFIPSANMGRDVATVITRASGGLAPEWDIMAVPDSYQATLAFRNLHQKFDYQKLGVDPKVIHYDNGSVAFAHAFVLPAYNDRILPAKDAPKSWEDVLDPKWKGGKLGVSSSTHQLARLALGPWGEAKTTNFVKALAEQKPNPGRLPELLSRLQIGEILIAVDMKSSIFYQAKKAGAPIVQAETIEPVISPDLQAGVIRNARHPNVAHLFAVFLTSPEAQKIWEAYNGESSAFVPGTPAHKFVQGRQVIFMGDKQAELVEKLASDYAKILGVQ